MRYYFEETAYDKFNGYSTMLDGKVMQHHMFDDGGSCLMDNATGEAYPIVYELDIPDTDLKLFVTEV